MLTLNGQRVIAGCNVYEDDADWRTFYYVSTRPRIALDEGGRPIFSLVLYRRDLSDLSAEELRTRLGGGLLTLSVELAPTDEELAEIRQTLAEEIAARRGLSVAAAAEQVSLRTMPAHEGTVILAVAGETADTGSDFVASMVGAGQASVVGTHRAAFMVKLTHEGAALVKGMIGRDLTTLFVGYSLKYHHRLSKVTMRVWADAQKSYKVLEEMWQELQDNARFSKTSTSTKTTYTFSHDESKSARDFLEETLGAQQFSRVDIIPEGPISDELSTELARQGHEMLKDFLASTFLQFDPSADFAPTERPTLETELPEVDGREYGHHGITSYSLKDWDRSMEATLDHTFTTRQVLEATLPIDENLSDLLGGQDVSQFIAHLDLESDFHKFLDVRVLCTADFEREPVDLVKVHLEYDQSGPDGRVRKVEDKDFQKNSAPAQFRTFLARPDLDQYRYEATVHYSESQQTFTFSGQTNDRILVLDVDTLGILDVAIEPGLVDWAEISQIKVRMSYGAGPTRREEHFILSKDSPLQRWVEVIGEAVAQPYTYQAIFVDKSGQQIETAPQRSTADRLLVDQPQEHTMRVDVVPAGVFAGDGGRLNQIKVALRYQDPDNDHIVETIATLTKASDSFTWRVPLINKERRSYEYQATVVYTDGVVREDTWRPTDKATLPVGDPFTYAVAINPRLLGLQQGRFALGKIHLAYEDRANDAFSEKTFQIEDFTKVIQWNFRLGSLEHKTYRYTLTLWEVEEDGDLVEIVLPEATHDEEVLILKPPPRG
jgi:hypothetical protein